MPLVSSLVGDDLIVIPSSPKQPFFLLSEGPSIMTDPELRGKTGVFPFPPPNIRSGLRSCFQKRLLAHILTAISYRIQANGARYGQIVFSMYRNSAFFATNPKKMMVQPEFLDRFTVGEIGMYRNMMLPQADHEYQQECLNLLSWIL